MKFAIAIGVPMAILGLFALLIAATASAHGDAAWIERSGLKGPDGVACCGTYDCHRVAPDEVTYRPGLFTVAWKTRALGFDEQHVRISPDHDWWACIPNDDRVRCLWRPAVGG